MVTCDICGRTFKNEHGLHIHQSRLHKDLANRPHESSSACATVPQESSRVQNEQTNKFPEETPRTPKRQSNEKKSSKTDSSKQGLEKTCKCTQCEKAFETERGLKTHMSRTHKTKQGVSPENSKKQESLKQDSDQDQSPTISTPLRSVERSVEIDSATSVGMSVDNDSRNRAERLMKNDGGNSTEIDSTSIVKRQDSNKNYDDKPKAVYGVSYDRDCRKTCTCTLCGRAFDTERGLKIHVGKIHKTTQGVTAENSKQPKSLKQDSNQDQSQTIKPQQRSVERSVDNYSGNSPDGSVDTDSGKSTEIWVDNDSGNSTEWSVDNYNGSSPERAVDNDSGNSTESIVKRNDSSRNYVDKQEAADDLELSDVSDSCQLPKKGTKNHRTNESLFTNVSVSSPPTYTMTKELSDVSDLSQLRKKGTKNHGTNESLFTNVSVSSPPTYTMTKGPSSKLLKRVDSNKLSKVDIQETVRVVNKLMEDFMTELKEISPSFGWSKFNSGSYYDKTKNSLPDEFDIMIYPKNLLVQVDFESNIQVPGFYKVKLVSPRCDEINSMVDNDGYIMPAGFKHYVFGLFDEVRSKIRQGRIMIKKEMSNDDSPAYTFDYKAIPSRRIDVDLVPSFRISGWPPIAKFINPKWLSRNKDVNDAVKCYDIVCKTFPEDVRDKDYLWGLSFSTAEKKLITCANDGNRNSNKKTAFKMIKSYIEKIKMNHPDKVKKFCSYHIKQFMLQQFDTWQEGEINSILRRLVSVLIDNLCSSPPHIYSYFIENDNVIRFVPDSEIQIIVEGLCEEIHALKR